MNGEQLKAGIRRLRESVFPHARRPVTLRTAAPLLIFLAVYAVLCVALDVFDVLLFARPWAFLLMLVTPWVWWMHVAGFSGLPRVRGIVALVLRFAMVGAFAMLLAEPRSVRTSDVLSVVYAVDVSDSVGDVRSEALEFVSRTAAEKPAKDRAGLVVFGGTPAVELPPRETYAFEAVNSRINRDATNLQQALALSAAMLPEDTRGRIVLVSDGTETEGSLEQILDELKAREITVDVQPIEYDYQHEVWIERLDLPQNVKIGESYEAAAILSSLSAGEGRVVLRESGREILSQDVTFQPGKNKFVFPIRIAEPGYFEYSATVELAPGQDNLRENNTAMNYIFVEGEGKVLLVRDPTGDERDWQNLVRAMREGDRAVDVMPAYEFPRDPLALMPYDCIVFVNVAADAFDSVQMQSVKESVRNLGLGFLMVGGENSFGPGGYHHTPVEDALPVTMDITKKKVLPKGALAIILHTCEFPQGNTWGKRITKQAIKVLGAQDEVGVLAYDAINGEGWVFELTPAGEYDRLVPKINAAEISDMPSFAATMELGLKGLVANDASAKHMIIISDGDPQMPSPELIEKFQRAQVTVSMVAIFPHGGVEIQQMRTIADVTGGRYYFPQDPNLLPSIFIKESKTLKRSMIQNKTVQPEVGMPSSVLKGLESLPPLHGYVLSTARDRAETVLRVPPDENGEGDLDPLLAIGNYGLGKSAAFTSDLSPNWGRDWINWEQYQAFVKQLVIRISRVRKEGHLRMWNYTSGNEGVIVVEDFAPEESFLEVHAQLSGPEDRVETVQLKQVGARRYQATVPLWGQGRYQVMVAGVGGDRKDTAYGGLIVPYSPEYLRFRSNPIVLKEIAERTGGTMLTPETSSDVIYGRRAPKQTSSPIFDWFLISLAILLPLDVAFRRVQVDFRAILRRLGWGTAPAESTATISTLLQRKQQVDAELGTGQRPAAASPKPSPARRPDLQRRPGTQPPRPQTADRKPDASPPPDDKPADNLSTTERLLAMKRKRSQDKPD